MYYTSFYSYFHSYFYAYSHFYSYDIAIPILLPTLALVILLNLFSIRTYNPIPICILNSTPLHIPIFNIV